jgi:hypothetical protein
MRASRNLVLTATLIATLLSGQSGAHASSTTRAGNPVEFTYVHDGFVANRCSGPTDALHYEVFVPPRHHPHPIAFMIDGTGWLGSADCNPSTGQEYYHEMDPVALEWAQAGYVVVNVEEHGFMDGLFGDMTYPGPGAWENSTVADAVVQIDVKAAVRFFFAHDPIGHFDADESLGLVAVGSSSGGHDAEMLALTGVSGHRFTAAVAWSGLPDARLGGADAQSVFDVYMRTTAGSDVESFGEPIDRLTPDAPPQYVANGTQEFESPAGTAAYFAACQALGVTSWLRILNTDLHGAYYLDYVFTGTLPEFTEPPARVGWTVGADSLLFASFLGRGS